MEYQNNKMMKSLNLLMRIPKCKKCGELKKEKVNIEMTHGKITAWVMNSFCGTCEKDEISAKKKRWQEYIKLRTNK